MFAGADGWRPRARGVHGRGVSRSTMDVGEVVWGLYDSGMASLVRVCPDRRTGWYVGELARDDLVNVLGGRRAGSPRH